MTHAQVVTISRMITHLMTLVALTLSMANSQSPVVPQLPVPAPTAPAGAAPPAVVAPVPAEKSFALTSTLFATNTAFPAVCTADGAGTSPPLAWTDAPKTTVSFAILMDDPQARGFVHWTIWGIPATTTTLAEAVPQDLEVKSPAGARQGVTSWGKERPGYWGSAPGKGSGVHHYTFTIDALDAQLDLKAGATAKQFKKAIEGHVLSTATLVGLYERPG